VLAQEVSVRQQEVEEAARNLRELRTLLETQKFNHKQDRAEWDRKLTTLNMENESLQVKLQVTEQEVQRLMVRWAATLGLGQANRITKKQHRWQPTSRPFRLRSRPLRSLS